MSMPIRPPAPRRSLARTTMWALVAVLGITGFTSWHLTSGAAPAEAAAPVTTPKTWIVDAVDDALGARWVSRDTGASEVTIQVGDTVEWRFEYPTARQSHDLTSQDTAQGTWSPRVQEYRDPSDPLGPVRHTFTEAGTYTYICSVHGTTMSGTVVVEAVGTDGSVVADASAAPAGGAAPLDVTFDGAARWTSPSSGDVTTRGPVKAFAAGLTAYPRLTGTAELARRRDSTYASLDVSGLKPNAHHMVHVHEETCSSNDGGAHFRFDESQPFAEANEIWLPFHSDASGRSGLVEVTKPQRAGADAVSIVIHDPDNMAKRIGCVDLAPDLTYTWTFGDGTTAQGATARHTYAAGTWTATLTVTDTFGKTDTDTVTVTASAPPVPPPVDPPVVPPTVLPPADTAAPETGTSGGPVGSVRSRSATFGLTSSEAGSTFACRLDDGGWQACRSPLAVSGLAEGRHDLLVRATDPAGNTDATPASRDWTVDRTGPAVRGASPTTTSDRTPTIRARVTDRLSEVRGRSVVLRVDGAAVAGVRYDARRGVLTWTPRRPLSAGRHAVRLLAVDGAGNRSVRTWRLRVLG